MGAEGGGAEGDGERDRPGRGRRHQLQRVCVADDQVTMHHRSATFVIFTLIRDFNDGDIEDEIREAFRMFDKEGNGFITSGGNIWGNSIMFCS